jgi:DNA polymerase I-like protein with 3'-5' exonuclease and polymerase domains
MEQLHIIRTLNELKELETYLSDKEFIAFDTETSGLDKDAEVIGFSVCADVEVGYYVILASWNATEQKLEYLETKSAAKDFMTFLQTKQLVMQNGNFDCEKVFDNFGVQLVGSLHTDTLIAGHLLNENRSNGLKERGLELYGESAVAEMREMKESITKNGGTITKDKYELYKADADLIARYGAKDAILTLKLFYNDVPQLYAENLDAFFYEDESMPLLRGPTYDMNTVGLKVDVDALQKLRQSLEAECLDALAFINKEIWPHVQERYPGTSKVKTFNLNSGEQLSWLLFGKLNNEFNLLTEGAKTFAML